MCGLSGAAGSTSTAEKKVVEELLIHNIVRGPHSTGVAAIPRDPKKKPLLVKSLGTPYGDGDNLYPGIFGLTKYNKMMSEVSKVFIGHNRWATKGAVSVENAHPFWFDKVVGAHNGTLWPGSLNKLKGDYETDSETIFNNINEEGIEKTAPKLDGAWALVWYDVPSNSINFLRNKERTLFFAFSEDKKCLFWSSDPHPLYYALDRAKIKIDGGKVSLLPEDTWMSWTVPDIMQAFVEPRRVKLEGYKYQHTGYTNFGKRGKNGSFMYEDAEFSDYVNDPFGFGWADDLNKPKDKEQGDLIDHVNYSQKNQVNQNPLPAIVNANNNVSQFPQKNMVQMVKERREKAFNDQLPEVPKSWVLRWDEAFHKVFFCKETEVWILFNYTTVTNSWMKVEMDKPPMCLPLKKTDPETGGHHAFHHSGKKKNKRVFFKGFNGRLLSPEAFKDIADEGCVNCQRKPVWGNIVRFFAERIFLCEHCESMPRVVKLLIKG